VKVYTGSGRNTWRFCKTVVSGTVGVGNLTYERSSTETRSISVAMERWSVEHRAFTVEAYLKNNDSVLTQRIFRRHFPYSSERVSLVAILLLLRISQEQGVWKETKYKGGFETEHQGRSGSNFSQHAATSDAELPETLGEMCWQGTPPHTHCIQEVNVVIKMLWVKDYFSNKFAYKGSILFILF
jgi:hypothetical protein